MAGIKGKDKDAFKNKSKDWKIKTHNALYSLLLEIRNTHNE